MGTFLVVANRRRQNEKTICKTFLSFCRPNVLFLVKYGLFRCMENYGAPILTIFANVYITIVIHKKCQIRICKRAYYHCHSQTRVTFSFAKLTHSYSQKYRIFIRDYYCIMEEFNWQDWWRGLGLPAVACSQQHKDGGSAIYTSVLHVFNQLEDFN